MRNSRLIAHGMGVLVLGLALSWGGPAEPQGVTYPWMDNYDPAQSLETRIPVPEGFERMTVSTGSFGDWLRHLPLKPGTPEVMLYNGQKKANQNFHQAVVDIDVGSQDLQQCADAVIRLKAEYEFSRGNYDRIHFQLTSGEVVDFARWSDGFRPAVVGNRVEWSKSGQPDWSHANLRQYLNFVYQFAGSISLNRELQQVRDLQGMRIGDVLVKPGTPGHAVIIVDMACDTKSSRRVFLLAQSFMPAQDVHILKNLQASRLSPWYDVDFGLTLATPEWTFSLGDLKRFAE